MITKKGAIGVALILSVACVMGQAEAQEKKWKGAFSGSYSNTELDADNNGQKATLVTLGGTSNLGAFSEQVLVEPTSTTTTPTTCPNGNAGAAFPIVPGTGHFVVRFSNG